MPDHLSGASKTICICAFETWCKLETLLMDDDSNEPKISLIFFVQYNYLSNWLIVMWLIDNDSYFIWGKIDEFTNK